MFPQFDWVLLRIRQLVLLLACGMMISVSHASTETEKAKQRLQVLHDRISTLTEEVRTAHKDRSSEHQKLREIEQDIGRVTKQLRTTKRSTQKQLRKLERLKLERVRAQTSLRQHQQLLSRQVRAAHAMGGQQQIKLLLNQQRPETFSRMNIYFEYITQMRADSVRETIRMVSRFDALVMQAEKEEQRLTELKQQQLVQRGVLKQGRATRKQVLAKLDLGLKSNKSKLKELQKNERRLKDLIAQLNTVIAALPDNDRSTKPFKSRKGKMVWPTNGKLVSRFGSRRLAGSPRAEGVVLAALAGSPVHAVADGRVVFSDWLRGFGLLTIIDHGQGYMSLYAHNQSLLHAVGDRVFSGEEIAGVGNSGGRKSDGLYFEIRYKGNPVNPAKWCRKGSNRA